ncbi:CoA-transferase, partial [Chloroflexota bacterium]
MKNKICKEFSEAVSDIPDGASIMISIFLGPGGVPQNLIKALRDHETNNLTIIACNFGQTAGTHSSTGFKPYIGPRLLLEGGQVKKAIIAFLAGFAEFSGSGVEIELTPYGTLVERIRAGGAGLGGFYSPVG